MRKLGVDEWLIRTVMALYTEACTVVRTDAGLSESFGVNIIHLWWKWHLEIGVKWRQTQHYKR